MRIGHGYDVHRFCEGNEIVLAGVRIPHDKGMLAHSDGDVVLHALCDALLGAAALGDIGRHFPDTDPRYAGYNSRDFVRAVCEMLLKRQWQVANVDVSVIAEAPKLASYVSAMVENIATDLQVHPSQVNVKATTHEGLDAIGQKQGIAVHSVVLLTPNL